jgi:hypothetical protein
MKLKAGSKITFPTYEQAAKRRIKAKSMYELSEDYALGGLEYTHHYGILLDTVELKDQVVTVRIFEKDTDLFMTEYNMLGCELVEIDTTKLYKKSILNEIL